MADRLRPCPAVPRGEPSQTNGEQLTKEGSCKLAPDARAVHAQCREGPQGQGRWPWLSGPQPERGGCERQCPGRRGRAAPVGDGARQHDAGGPAKCWERRSERPAAGDRERESEPRAPARGPRGLGRKPPQAGILLAAPRTPTGPPWGRDRPRPGSGPFCPGRPEARGAARERDSRPLQGHAG